MRKLFESGLGFWIVALLCLVAAILAENGAIFVSVGAFWFIMGVIVRSKNARKQSKHKDDTTDA